MTRLNLTETCLLEVSGELGMKAHQQLREHMAEIPAAKLEFELIKAQYDLLRTMPKPVLTEEQKRQYASNIKQGIHRKLREAAHQEVAQRRWKLVYQALAGISAAAACIVIGAAIYGVNASQQAKVQQAKLDRFYDKYNALLNSGHENDTDVGIRDVAQHIDELEGGRSPALLSAHSKEMHNLLEALSDVPNEEQAPPAPGSL